MLFALNSEHQMMKKEEENLSNFRKVINSLVKMKKNYKRMNIMYVICCTKYTGKNSKKSILKKLIRFHT